MRTPLVLAAATVAVTLALPPSGQAAVSAQSASSTVTGSAGPVILNGEGSFDVLPEEANWHNDVYGSSGTIDLNYLPQGGYIGRQDFLSGNEDYVISGVPFTSQELANLPGGASDVIAAPVMPSALGILLQPPQDDQNQPFTVIEGSEDPTPGQSDAYTGPVDLPYENLVAMLFHDTAQQPGTQANSGGSTLAEWDNQDVLSAWPQCAAGQVTSTCLSYDPTDGDQFLPDFGEDPNTILQSEPNEDTYYLQQLASVRAPAAWSDLRNTALDDNPPHVFGPIDDFLEPGLGIVESQGVPLVLEKIAQGGVVPGGSQAVGGVLAAVPPWALSAIQSGENGAPRVKNAEWVGVQNGASQWVTPTPASIDAAIDANGAAPLSGLGDASSTAAYPLTWVDDLYAPAHGLSMAKTNAMASLIRYLATDGQKYMAANGDGQLSPALVVQALNAANDLVSSNCTESGEQVVSDASPGPDAPDTPALSTLGLMEHCEAIPTVAAPTTSVSTVPPSSTTVAPTTTSTTLPHTVTSSAVLPSLAEPIEPSSDFSSPTSAATTTTTTTTTVPARTTTTTAPPVSSTTPSVAPALVPPTKRKRTPPLDVAETAAELPIASLSTGGDFDRLAALGVGAGLFLALRRPVRSLLRSLWL